MTDNVERLRERARGGYAHDELSEEAADEIERLRAHVEELQEKINIDTIPVMGIRLRKDGEHTVVDAEVGGAWIEVIRERSDGEFCHIIEPSGIWSIYYGPPPRRHRKG